ncbi:MAG: GerMN domain-containing protein [Treponema sp.]|jgi:hypothetical protein|nr:GerMN domain-containing protein [Treponema sp.]
MRRIVRGAVNGIVRFFRRSYCRRFIYLLLLGIPALFEYWSGGFVRRTFVFYVRDTGKAEVESRLLPLMPSRELSLEQYVEEALLGPVSPESDPLFLRGTALRSLLYRDGTVYADLSLSAALPYSAGTDAFRSLYVLYRGIRRNFSFVKDVRLFIEGKEAYYERFRGVSFFPARNRASGTRRYGGKILNIVLKTYKCA